MKKPLLLLTILLIPSKILPEYTSRLNEIVILVPERAKPYEDLWNAMCFVESTHNPNAVNEPEQAYGIVQIRQCKLDDYINQTGDTISLNECFDPGISYKIWMHFATQYNGNYKTIAKKWNGSGPMTEVYWQKVYAVLISTDSKYRNLTNGQ